MLPERTGLIDQLLELPLLTAPQRDELIRDLRTRFPEPRALARELLNRDWLTPFQANQLLNGKGRDLVLGRYVLLQRLGKGGMAQVFKARHPESGRVVALKLLRPERTDNPAIVERLFREVRATARLRHLNVAAVYDAGEADGRYFTILEYLEGTDLDRLVRENGPLPPARAGDYARQAALGLRHIHEFGLVHRDIKPDNLFLTNAGVIKILDLGLARLAGAADKVHHLTVTGMVLGSLDYIAPEQATRSETADIRADIYALGCTLYFLLTGKPPFAGGGPVQKLAWHLHAEPPRVEELAPHGMPHWLPAVVRKMMAKKREDRYQTPAEVVEALTPPGGAPLKCPFCHFVNEDGALFCERCKSDLTAVEAPPPPKAASKPPSFAPRPAPAPFPPPPGLEEVEMPDNDVIPVAEPMPHEMFPATEVAVPPPSSPNFPEAPTAAPPPPPADELDAQADADDEPSSDVLAGDGPGPGDSTDPSLLGDDLSGGPDTGWPSGSGRRRREEPAEAEDLWPSPDDSVDEAPMTARGPRDARGGGLFGAIFGAVAGGFSALAGWLRPRPAAEEEPESVQAFITIAPPVVFQPIRRHTDVSFPARVPAGETFPLRVRIVPAEKVLPSGEVRDVPRPHAHDATMSLTPPRPGEPARVTVSVAAENFTIDAPARAELEVPSEGPSAAVQFRLTGQSVGPGRIMLDFSQDGRPVGSVNLTPQVVAAGGLASAAVAASGPDEGLLGLAARPGPAPDVVLKVFEHRFAELPGRLHFVLHSTHPKLQDLPVWDGDLGTLDLRGDVAAWVEGQLAPLGEVAQRPDATAEDVRRVLCRVGYNLYDRLLPKPLQELCWTLRGRGMKSVLVLSDDPHIPWELIKPYRQNAATGDFEDEDDFWGESFALAHWLRGRPPPERLALQRVVACASGAGKEAPPGTAARDLGVAGFVALPPLPSDAALPAADEELQVLRSLASSGATVEVLPALKARVCEALERGGFDVLHLACHGSFGGATAADASALLLEDGLFQAAELSPKMAGPLRRSMPLVFFNACHSGRTGFALTGLGSWGARLVQLGCGGFLGALWPVTDRAALAFARAFYGALCQGLPIGEAVLRARKQVHQQYPADPTWLAYRCFADPLARLTPTFAPGRPAPAAPQNS